MSSSARAGSACLPASLSVASMSASASASATDPGNRMSIVQRLATESVTAVLAGRSLTPTLESILARHTGLLPTERSALWDLTHGTLRHLGLMREILRQVLRRPVKERGLEALLAVSIYQLEFTRAAPYAVVNEAVESTALLGWPWA